LQAGIADGVSQFQMEGFIRIGSGERNEQVVLIAALQAHRSAVNSQRVNIERNILRQGESQPLADAAQAIESLNGDLATAGDDHSHDGAFDAAALDLFEFVACGGDL